MHLPHEIMWNANLMQQGNFIDISLARHVSGTYAHHQQHQMMSCSIWFSAPSFWMGGGLESRSLIRSALQNIMVTDCALNNNKIKERVKLH